MHTDAAYMQETPKFAKLSNAVFDESGNFIVYATLEGIKVGYLVDWLVG